MVIPELSLKQARALLYAEPDLLVGIGWCTILA
jgi:hypothetical protein